MRFSSFVLRALCCLFLIVATAHCCMRRSDYADYSISPDYLLNSTVAMVAESPFGDGFYTYCSGVWISPTKFLTAKHCVVDDNNVDSDPVGTFIRFKTRREVSIIYNRITDKSPYWGLVLGVDPDYDLALVSSVDDVRMEHTYVGVSHERINIGDEVRIVGHTAGMQYSYLTGIISAVRIDEEDGNKYLQISSSAFRGNSGGAAFDRYGNIVGICSSIYIRAPNVVFFVHRDTVLHFLES